MKYPVYKLFKLIDSFYLYDRNKNALIRLSSDEYSELKNIEKNKRNLINTRTYKKLNKAGYLQENRLEKIEHPCTKFTNHFLSNHIEQLTLQVTQRCNLRCKYCVYSGVYDDRNRVHSDYDMTFAVAKKAIDFYLERAIESEKYVFGFYGGEPLLKFDLIKECVNYINEFAKDKEIDYTITTNGTILTDEIIEFLDMNNFSIVISIDGSKEEHNKNRIFKNGKGSYDTIVDNLKRINKKYPNTFKKIRFNTVLNPNQDFPKLKSYFEEDDLLGDSMVMMQLVDNKDTEKVVFSDEFYRAMAFDRFKLYLYMIGKIRLSEVSKLILPDYFFIKEQYRQISSENSLPSIYHHSGPCIPGAKRLFINTYEKLYPCERVGENSDVMVIGSIKQGFNLDKVNNLLNVGKITETECKNCWALLFCDICCKKADGKSNLCRKEKLYYCKESKESANFQLSEICALKELGCTFEERGMI